MTNRWFPTMTKEDVDKRNANVRASRTHRLADTVQDSRVDSEVAKPPQERSHGDPGETPGHVQGRKTPRKRLASASHPSEHDEQVALIRWWDAYAALHKIDHRLLFAIPNGGSRHKAVAGKLKAEGVRAGVPDLMLAIPVGGRHGLFLELKSERGSLRPRQKEFQEILWVRGYAVAWCKGAPAARKVIEDYLSGKP